MKLLFVIDRADAKDDPNINLVLGVLPHLTQGTQVPEVRFLGHTAHKEGAIKPHFYYGRDEAVRGLYASLSGLSPLQKLWKLMCHPVNSAFGLCKALHIDFIAQSYRRHIETLCRDWKPDAIIAVAAPFYTAKAVATTRMNVRKIIWMFDPYGAHFLMGGKISKWQERRCFARVDKVFVPELLMGDYQSCHRVQAMAFPGLCEPAATQAQQRAANAQLKQAAVALVFVGSLYADIRNPAPLLRLVRALGDTVHLTIVGGLYGQYTAQFHTEFDDFMAQNVTLVGKVDKQTAQRYLQQADVLVTIGNTVENQLPSKIFECFATGQPILNLRQLAQCPADGYVQKYPLAYTVDAWCPLQQQTICEVAAFLKEMQGKHLPFAAVMALYPENTPEAVAQKLLAAAKGA